MGKVFAFHGGIHPPENKHQSTQTPITKAPLAKQLFVPLQQHIGAPAKSCVKLGDRVLKGQRIASAQGPMSVAVHAPSSGIISAVDLHPIPHPSGMSGMCITIDTDGQERWIEHSGLTNYKSLTKAELIEYIRDRGIAGMGGAGFPTAVKLRLGDNHIVNTLIINAAECEPYITADDMLIRERAEQIVAGIDVLQHLIKPSHIIIGIEDNKPQAFRALEIAIKDRLYNIDVACIPTKYPSGGEKQLIKLLTDIEIPSGRIPADVGIVCQNIGTVYAISRAVHFGESLISRVVTVTGDATVRPGNYEVLLGTPFSLLLESAGQYENKISRLIIGGPMMGYTIENDKIPVVKASNCIIAATTKEMPTPEFAQACIRCGLCEQVCPASLLPQQLHWFAKSLEYDKAQQHNLFDCIECGACSYVCPSNIPLVQYYRHAKTSIRQEALEKRKSDAARERFEARKMREERAETEKAAKRAARAEQAAKAQADKSSAPSQAQAAPTSASEPITTDIKQLKTAAAVARTKLKKAQSALKVAQQKNQPGIDTLQLTVTQLEQSALQADQALEKVGGHSTISTPTTAKDPKALKTAAAVARTKLKKAQATLEKLDTTNVQYSELELEITKLKDKVIHAEQAYRESEGTDVLTKSNDAAQADADKALKVLDKARSALQKAEQDNSPAVEKMRIGVAKLEAKYQIAIATLSSAPAVTGVPTPLVDSKVLKQAAAIARTKLKKLQSQYDKLEAGDPLSAELEQQISSMQLKVTTSEQVLAQSEPAIKADTSADDAQLKHDKALKVLEKSKVALSKAEKDNNPAVDKIRASVAKLEQKYQDALAALPSERIAAKKPSALPVDKKALKQAVAIARTKLKKAQNIDQPDDMQQLETERLAEQYQVALAALETFEAPAYARANTLGVDLDALRKEFALANAAATKAQKALDKSDHSERKTLEQQLHNCQESAQALEQKLRSIEQ